MWFDNEGPKITEHWLRGDQDLDWKGSEEEARQLAAQFGGVACEFIPKAAHREHVLAQVAKLWERHPDLSFCSLIDRYVISIGTMAGHTPDEAVIERCQVED